VSIEVLVTVGSGIAAASIAALVEAVYRRMYPKQKPTLDDRINKLTSALRNSSKLIAEVEDEIDSRHKLVKELQRDAESYQKLVELNKDQVDAVAQLLQGELRKENRGAFWKGIGANFVFFLLGAGVSWYLSVNF